MRGRGLLCGIALSLLLRPPPPAAAEERLQPELVVPRWAAPGGPGSPKHPLQAEVTVKAEGQELVLELEKNRNLFAPGYTETHYSQTGQAQSTPLSHTCPSHPCPSHPICVLPICVLPIPVHPICVHPIRVHLICVHLCPSDLYPSHPCPSHPCTSHLCPSYSCPSHPCPSHPCPSHPCSSHPYPSHPCPSHRVHPILIHPIPVHPIVSIPSLSIPPVSIPSHLCPSRLCPSYSCPSHPCPSHAIPVHPIPVHPIPVHPIPVHPIVSIPSMSIPSLPIPSMPIPTLPPSALQDHCFYHGVVRGWEGSSVTLSTCRGLRGLIVLSSNSSYILEPAPNSTNQHLIYRVDNLRLQKGACGYQGTGDAAEDWLRSFTSGMKSPGQRVRRDTLQATKYVELLLVADYAEFQKHHFSIEATKQKLLEAANYVDKFYRALNIRIALVGLEIWNERDKCDVTENPYFTLKSFLAWSSKERLHRKHDNAQLITGVPFKGTTVGLAPVMAMCSDFQSGGVNMDHSDNAIGVAATIAHEMGHNFGMNHDSAGCCSTPAADGGCIMASATGHPFPKVFNQCNRQELEKYLQSGGGMCLSNMPDTKRMYGGGKCGNGYLEEGEECDCGEVEDCRNPCCDPRTCSLKPGAECAHGSCCHQCKLVSPGTLCRKSSGLCDLPEFCTGESPFCPLNSYQMDGAPCDGDKAYCYSGMCLTYRDQCVQLWGPGAQPAPDACFEKVNAAGDKYGNCGKDIYGNYRKCEIRDAKCGKIQCQSSAFKPLQPNAVAIDTTVNRQRCRGTHVYRPDSEEKEMLDPGLVLTGTKCGSHHVCFEGRCQNVSIVFEAESCSKKCHGHGVCNNNKNCHCHQGWAPPFCNKEGTGGSLDSGPPLSEGSSAVVIALAILAPILLLIGILFLFYYLKCWSKFTICSLKKTPQFSDTSGTGHANPAFKLRTPQQQRKVIGFPEIPPKPPQPAPGLQMSRQQAPSSLGSPSVGQPVGPALPKDIPRRTPPSRPAPPAPKPPTSQDISRPRPPQRALPANPIPSRGRGWQGSSPVPLPPGHCRAPAHLQPVAERAGAWTAGPVKNLKVGQPGSRGHS